MSDKKKRSWLSRLGFKSKEEKLALEAARKAEEDKIIDAKMAEKMAVINAAALKASHQEDTQQTSTKNPPLVSPEKVEKQAEKKATIPKTKKIKSGQKNKKPLKLTNKSNIQKKFPLKINGPMRVML